MSTYLQLTQIDKLILESYSRLVNDLGMYLGEGYEIILHSLENLDSSVVKIYNGHYSNRKSGAPITNFALSMLSKIQDLDQIKSITYFNKSKTGAKLRSCTIPILGENSRIIALLCINYYTDITLDALIKKFTCIEDTENVIPEVQENFTESIDDLLYDTLNEIRKEVFANKEILTSNKNKYIIYKLYENGIFNLKDSVIKVAEQLNISKNTVYLHIRNFEKNGK
ncbi:PAS domain-containing protein [Fusobacterium sp. SYSU M8D902]|uniref:helix-turn-helix transcriptional regulator n=1 Tax=Fusobacterium sp. SYSU M8D902 TaxID=3159562 RepID=UPI0032E4CCAE